MLNKKDLLILTELRKNSRESLTRMSKNTSIPVSTIHDRIRSYKNDLIAKHTSIIDFSKLGFNARAQILIKVGRENRKEASNLLKNHQNINSVHKISNGYDFSVEGIFRNVKDVEDFLDSFSERFQTEKLQVHYIIEDIKKEAFMSKRELSEII